ncbi:hypothetical protein OH492_12650 [Vibrio chagasii]|nr:hypothetical protein [Vibrio chagasii]
MLTGQNLQNEEADIAMRNSQDTISMMQTAEGAMDEMTYCLSNE